MEQSINYYKWENYVSGRCECLHMHNFFFFLKEYTRNLNVDTSGKWVGKETFTFQLRLYIPFVLNDPFLSPYDLFTYEQNKFFFLEQTKKTIKKMKNTSVEKLRIMAIFSLATPVRTT